jgi:4-alpha-glucanotransferase
MNEKKTGTAIPLAALKTENSCGCGDFLDLIPFADFCKKANLELIQLLPVNDTGTESSPYSALSAFALHPMYIRISALPEILNKDKLQKEEKKIAEIYNSFERFPYRELRDKKIALLQKIFNENKESILSDAAKPKSSFGKWIKDNHWIRFYAVFMEFKRKNKEASWKSWSTNRNLSQEKIIGLWEDENKKEKHLFYAWVQMKAHEQFLKASEYVQSLGIQLKGDIPIMMNEDSCDAWAFPEFFNTSLRAGSPPDGPNPLGQNWGFPTYNWENLAKKNYSWWKDRLIQASKYYQVYRIDHVLGFFRIWSIPEGECTAMNGWTQPFEPITEEELIQIGFNVDRIKWLAKPHVPTKAIEEVNNNDYLGTHGHLGKIMDRIGNEELWLFKDSITGDKDIWAREDIPHSIRERLAEFWRNRMLVEVAPKSYVFQWTFRNSTAWSSLNWEEKQAMEALSHKKAVAMEALWEKQGRTLLGELTKATKMIPCAEDLGANTECVPIVLQNLEILSLRVVRWSREWEKAGQPYNPLQTYPSLSVTTSSVHDSSTMRLWWLTEPDAVDFYNAFASEQTKKQISPKVFTPETAYWILSTMALSNSQLCIHPIQDFLSLSQSYYAENPENERVNVPGSVNTFNWTYRLPVSIKNLLSDEDLCGKIKAISLRRHEK